MKVIAFSCLNQQGMKVKDSQYKIIKEMKYKLCILLKMIKEYGKFHALQS